MGTFLTVIGFLGFITCLILALVSIKVRSLRKGSLAFLLLSIALLILGSVLIANPPGGIGSSSSSTVSTLSPEEYKAACTELVYEDIARNPDTYKGTKAVFTGKVAQTNESGKRVAIRLQVTEGEFGLWDDAIYVEYTRVSDSESRILEGDIITVYGELNGTKTYRAVLGNNVTVPYLKAKYIELSQ